MSFFNPLGILAVIVALTLHEWAHAVVATRLGDPTPHNEGRLTVNPLAHLDPLGAFLFLTVGFGWAKPVPVNPRYFSDAKRGMLLTAAAGPFINLILAFAFFRILLLVGGGGESVWGILSVAHSGSLLEQFLGMSVLTNLSLMAFNLLPIGPLDGSKVLEAFVPYHFEDKYQEYLRVGPYILLALLLADRFVGIDVFGVWMTWIMDAVLHAFMLLPSGVLMR